MEKEIDREWANFIPQKFSVTKLSHPRKISHSAIASGRNLWTMGKVQARFCATLSNYSRVNLGGVVMCVCSDLKSILSLYLSRRSLMHVFIDFFMIFFCRFRSRCQAAAACSSVISLSIHLANLHIVDVTSEIWIISWFHTRNGAEKVGRRRNTAKSVDILKQVFFWLNLVGILPWISLSLAIILWWSKTNSTRHHRQMLSIAWLLPALDWLVREEVEPV